MKYYLAKAWHSTLAGNSGNNIRYLRQSFGVTVSVPRSEDPSTEIEIEGDRAEEAVALIQQKLGFSLSTEPLVDISVDCDGNDCAKLFTGNHLAQDMKTHGVGIRPARKYGDFLVVQGPQSSVDAVTTAWSERLGRPVLDRKQATTYDHKVDITSGKIAECIFFGDGDADDEHDLDRFIEILRSGNETLDICIFTITCNRIARAIENEHRSGVKVRIITDNHTAEALGSDIESLSRQGIPIKKDISEGHMHHKFCVIDHKLVMNGSFNWTRGASSVNYENVMVTNEKAFVDGYSENFERMWNDSARFVDF